MKKFISINRRALLSNRANHKDDPVIRVTQGDESIFCHTLAILGPSLVVYDEEHPLECGAKVWIETDALVQMGDYIW